MLTLGSYYGEDYAEKG